MSIVNRTGLDVPFFRPSITTAEIEEVVACLRSGWLTTGPRVKEFEDRFAAAVGGQHAVAVNSCTAALHLAVEALRLRRGQAVLVPTMTFAATAEVVRYQGAVPILVDCDPRTMNIDLQDAERKLSELRAGRGRFGSGLKPVGIMPVHVGGLMLNLDRLEGFAWRHGLWVVEDAAHAFPAAYRSDADQPWRQCGGGTADVSCFSFYGNKTITTGEGGMAVTGNDRLARRMRRMSLHGLSRHSWARHNGTGSWDYRIVAPGFKYNMPDLAASLGIHQLQRSEAMRREREATATWYRQALESVEQLELPPVPKNRRHAWHLFAVRLHLDQLRVGRNALVKLLRRRGIGTSVHWRPLHLHPYYRRRFGWQPTDCPAATFVWKRLISLPLFPGMLDRERQYVCDVLGQLCLQLAAENTASGGRPAQPR